MTALRDIIGMKVYGDRVPSFDHHARRNVRPEVWWQVANNSWNNWALQKLMDFQSLSFGDFHAD